MFFDDHFEVLVIGAGHAGCEAASAAARMGCRTAIVTMSLDLIGQMSCNPAIGGVAKGHLVREVDAMGGIMGRVIDRTGIQFRLLNRSRGPAVQSPRAQADRAFYRMEMRHLLEATAGLSLRQGQVVELLVEHGSIAGVELLDGRRIGAKAVIVATGTFLNGLVHTGRRTYSAGRAGEPASVELSDSLRRLGFPVGRLKTGTPPRLDGRTVHWDAFEPQPGDEKPVPFSFSTESLSQPQVRCHIGYTNQAVHEAIRARLSDSPLYSGQIKGVGPRYCPSIEDKVVKFADKDRHQLFLEPEGWNTHEVYLNGFSTSLPSELQLSLVRLIEGLGEAEIIRPGYAIEYDYVDPRELSPDMQTVRVPGLFLAGQINGTTGYEEAACQGFIAGVNAALRCRGNGRFQLGRHEAYVGVLIDDLVTQGVDEPYRIFTSRAENRLTLRHDNADRRLMSRGRAIGLVDDTEWDRFNSRRDRIALVRHSLESRRLKRSDSDHAAVCRVVGSDIGDSVSLAQLALRSDVPRSFLLGFLQSQHQCGANPDDVDAALADLLYSRYVENQNSVISRVSQHDRLAIPDGIEYSLIPGLSREMVERLHRVRPGTFGQARRIPGLTSSCLSTLLVHLLARQKAA